MNEKILNVTIWNEYRHEKTKPECKELYPEGLHAFIKSFLDTDATLNVRLAALDDEFQGLPDDVLNSTDVLLWWGHVAHAEVCDELSEKIRQRIYEGKMGLVALHSAHRSKVFCRTVGTNGNLSWGRNQKEIMWNLLPGHPIAAGIPDHFELFEELYCEPFYVPQPDELVFGGWFEDGYIFRAGLCYHRGAGKIFYFQPGHETCKSFYDGNVQRIIRNAIRWAAPNEITFEIGNNCPHVLDALN